MPLDSTGCLFQDLSSLSYGWKESRVHICLRTFSLDVFCTHNYRIAVIWDSSLPDEVYTFWAWTILVANELGKTFFGPAHELALAESRHLKAWLDKTSTLACTKFEILVCVRPADKPRESHAPIPDVQA